MSNVILLPLRAPRPDAQTQLGHLAESFASHRRATQDVWWLKENGELLNVLQTAFPTCGDAVLAPYQGFYAELEQTFAFFPQYYRFYLGLCLDLEDLGMFGTVGERIVHAARSAGLHDAELSDLQRAEALRLFNRRGHTIRDDGLADRLRAFAGKSDIFALPNKKAAYELTHIVFYLSEYGRIAPNLPKAAERSLHNVGILAHLEGNADLLAEVAVALQFCGWAVPAAWTDIVGRAAGSFSAEEDPSAPLDTAYHTCLMCHWHRFLTGDRSLSLTSAPGRLLFRAPQPASTLGPLSEALLALGPSRSADWGSMAGRLESRLSETTAQRLFDAAASSAHFEAFFATFARAPLPVAQAV